MRARKWSLRRLAEIQLVGDLRPAHLINRTLLSLKILNLAKCCTYEPSVPRVHITEARTPAPRHATPQVGCRHWQTGWPR